MTQTVVALKQAGSSPVFRSALMTHAELVTRAARWLESVGCPIVFAEMVTINSEIPDVIGWRNSAESFMVECKRRALTSSPTR